MNTNLKRKLAISAAGAIVLAGAGGTYAATRGGDAERDAFVAAAAKRLDVSPEKLKSALEGAFSDRLDAAVRAGRLTQKEADEIKQRAKEHGGLPPFGPPHGNRLHFRFGGPGGPRGPVFGGFQAAAKYLGLSREALQRQLHAGSGKSLADVAKARGKSVDGLEDAMKDGIRSELEKAVDAKHLTDGERDRMLKALEDHVDHIVSHKHGRPPLGERGFRFRVGPPPPGEGISRAPVPAPVPLPF